MNKNTNQCPHCNSSHYIKHGKYNGIQRFLCRECNKTFSQRTYAPWYYSKKSDNLWKKFWILQMNKVSLYKCAETLDINIATAFSWRHKILNAINHIIGQKELCDNVYMTKKIYSFNYKGSKLPSPTHDKNLWVILSADSNENTLITPLCTNKWDPHAFKNLLETNISMNSLIFTSGDRYLSIATKTDNPVRDHCYLSEINEYLNSNIEYSLKPKILVKSILDEFRSIKNRAFGVATKYLKQYFALARALQDINLFSFNSVICRWYTKDHYLKSNDISSLTVLN